MNRPENIEKIKNACDVATYRDADNHHRCNCEHDYFDHISVFGAFRGGCESCPCEEFTQQREKWTLRLADVLLAMEEFDGTNNTHVGFELAGGCAHYALNLIERKKFWDLKEDDLTAQSDECLEFIASLL